MKIALVSEKFIDRDINHNLKQIQYHANDLSGKADMICFGEAYLQGFDALSWNYDKDKTVALSNDSENIEFIKQLAKDNHIAIAFGYFELDKNTESIYCSYMVIDSLGKCRDHYRRVSIGWKEYKKTDKHYKEGKDFHAFEYLGKRIVVGLCGDLWYGKNIKKINHIDSDFVLWPLHIDYTIEMWNREKVLYERQSSKINAPVLMVNNISETSVGGSYYFVGGKILKELPMGNSGILIVDC
ncbi:MAG: carbon-nitrogen hydrolase family protein [Tenericutes bacterium]|jgi:predicted amidohydrolase|nr:carbon-nitrogen hydrolase family protein [Mycoplasmatota bacterium]